MRFLAWTATPLLLGVVVNVALCHKLQLKVSKIKLVGKRITSFSRHIPRFFQLSNKHHSFCKPSWSGSSHTMANKSAFTKCPQELQNCMKLFFKYAPGLKFRWSLENWTLVSNCLSLSISALASFISPLLCVCVCALLSHCLCLHFLVTKHICMGFFMPVKSCYQTQQYHCSPPMHPPWHNSLWPFAHMIVPHCHPHLLLAQPDSPLKSKGRLPRPLWPFHCLLLAGKWIRHQDYGLIQAPWAEI